MKLIKFGADWCNPCKIQNKEFEENPPKIELQIIDVDKSDEDLVSKYNIKNIPVTILIDNDKEIHRWNGFTKSYQINDYIDNLNKIVKSF